MTTKAKKIAGVAHAIAIDGCGALYDVTYVGCADCDSSVPWRYLVGLARAGYRVEVAASHADGDVPCVLIPHSAEIVTIQ